MHLSPNSFHIICRSGMGVICFICQCFLVLIYQNQYEKMINYGQNIKKMPSQFHTFVEIDHNIISTVILLPFAELFKKRCCQFQANVNA